MMQRAGFHTAVVLAGAMLAASPAAAQMTGPRLELHAGWDRPDFSVTYDDGVDAFSDSQSENGVLFGIEAGYDVALDSSGDIMFGILAGFDLSTAKRCIEVFGNDRACLKAGREWEVGGRLSTRVGERSLVYLKASYVTARLKATYEDFDNVIADLSGHDDESGVRFAGGFETAISERAYAKIEYRYTDFSANVIANADVDQRTDLTRHQVVGGVGMRF